MAFGAQRPGRHLLRERALASHKYDDDTLDIPDIVPEEHAGSRRQQINSLGRCTTTLLDPHLGMKKSIDNPTPENLTSLTCGDEVGRGKDGARKPRT